MSCSTNSLMPLPMARANLIWITSPPYPCSSSPTSACASFPTPPPKTCSKSYAPLRTHEHAANIQPSRRRLGQALRRRSRRQRHARPPAPSRPRPKSRTQKLAHQNRPRRVTATEIYPRPSENSLPKPIQRAINILVLTHLRWPLFKCPRMAGFKVPTEGEASPRYL